MEKHACIGPGVDLYNMATVTMGEYSIASQGAVICAGSHDVDSETFQLVTRPIEIGAYAWIASRAFVAPGVVIGEGAVLSAHAAAFKDLKPWTIYRGNPAEYYRDRGTDIKLLKGD